MRNSPNNITTLTTSATLVILVLCASSETIARGLRQLHAVPTSPVADGQFRESIQQRSRGSATNDLERLLQNSQIVRSALSSSVALDLSERPSPSNLSILLRSRPAPDRTRVTQALANTLQAWGTPQLQSLLSSGYYDAKRLQSDIGNRIPTDARLELLRLENFRIINDDIVTTANNELARVWLVVADAITQVELNDPVAGFVSLRGKQRYTLHLFDLAALNSAIPPLIQKPLRENLQ